MSQARVHASWRCARLLQQREHAWIAEPALDAHAPFVLQRIEVVNRLEARRFGIVIDAAYVGEKVELKRRVFFQESTEVDDLLRLDGKGADTMRSAEILDCPSEAPDDRRKIDTAAPRS